jgi:hypothetical protein
VPSIELQFDGTMGSVAGGTNRRGGQSLPMAERVRLGQQGRLAPPDDLAYPGRHCWVLDPADGTSTRRAGLLLEWRQRAGAWEGQVAYLCRRSGRGWLVTVEWLPESVLEVAVAGSP